VAVTERMLGDTCLALVGPIKLTSVEMCGHANRADEAPSLNPYKAIPTTDDRPMAVADSASIRPGPLWTADSGRPCLGVGLPTPSVPG
jgi:hypothetical protein